MELGNCSNDTNSKAAESEIPLKPDLTNAHIATCRGNDTQGDFLKVCGDDGKHCPEKEKKKICSGCKKGKKDEEEKNDTKDSNDTEDGDKKKGNETSEDDKNDTKEGDDKKN